MRSIQEINERNRIEKFSFNWMASNLTQEGMEKVVKDMKSASKIVKEEKQTKEEVGKEWSRLAAFQQR